MTFRYPKWLAYSRFVIALAMLVALYVGTNPPVWGWLLFLGLFLVIVYEGVRSHIYSLTVDGDRISVAGIKRGQYRVSDITAINVWFAKGGRVAVINFSNREKLNFSSHLVDFDKLVALLRTQANLPEQPPGH
jgi:hypothetical protein